MFHIMTYFTPYQVVTKIEPTENREANPAHKHLSGSTWSFMAGSSIQGPHPSIIAHKVPRMSLTHRVNFEPIFCAQILHQYV
jgi:hypothetical protein